MWDWEPHNFTESNIKLCHLHSLTDEAQLPVQPFPEHASFCVPAWHDPVLSSQAVSMVAIRVDTHLRIHLCSIPTTITLVNTRIQGQQRLKELKTIINSNHLVVCAMDEKYRADFDPLLGLRPYLRGGVTQEKA